MADWEAYHIDFHHGIKAGIEMFPPLFLAVPGSALSQKKS